jgi:hypothetical protein
MQEEKSGSLWKGAEISGSLVMSPTFFSFSVNTQESCVSLHLIGEDKHTTYQPTPVFTEYVRACFIKQETS